MKISTQKRKTEKASIFCKIGIFSVSILAASGAVYFYSPVIGTHAESSDFDIHYTMQSNLSLTLDRTNLGLNTTVGSFVSGDVNATVVTNSQYGYTLALEDKDDSSNLVHSNPSVSDVLTSDFSDTKTSSTMSDNTWGFSLNATDYSKVPVNGSPVSLKRTNTKMTAESETTAINFGAKTGLSIAAGTYQDVVVFTAYVNGQEDGGQSTANKRYMQTFSCSSLENVGDSVVLTDARDDNDYTVKKLADGKCWMTENLRIQNMTVTSENTNLLEGESFDIAASDITTGFGYNVASLSDGVYIDSDYGGYYNFYTATAGWGTLDVSTANLESPKDICPKTWKLPTGKSGDSEYATLASLYNTRALIMGDPNMNYTGYIQNGQFNMKVLPGGTGDGYGFYWSSTNLGKKYTYGLYFLSYNTDTVKTDMVRKDYGLPIRCLATN